MEAFNKKRRIQRKWQGVQKNLYPGQIFGEVSILYGCRRTATIKAKQFGSCATIKAPDFMKFLQNYPDYRKYLETMLIANYDDDLKIFLTKTLRQLDYLKNIDEPTLIHIAFTMSPEHRKAGSELFKWVNHLNTQEQEEIERRFFN